MQAMSRGRAVGQLARCARRCDIARTLASGLPDEIDWNALQGPKTLPRAVTLDLRASGGIRHSGLRFGDPYSADKLLLLLHANSFGAGSWVGVARRLVVQHNICAIAMDHRGHGESDSPEPAAAFAWRNHGADSVRMIDELASWYGRSVDAVITHSFSGDALLLTLADAHPTPAGGRPAAPLFGATNDSSDLALARARATPLILLDPVLADAAGAASGGAVRQLSRHHVSAVTRSLPRQ